MSAPTVIPAATEGDRIAIAIDRHVTATSTTLARVFTYIAASLEEPRASDLGFARHHLGDLVHTLLHVATGAVIGRVVSSALRSFGTDREFRIELPLREALRGLGTRGEISAAPALAAARPSLVDDAARRPLINELGMHMLPRLAHAGRDHHAALARLASAVPAGRVVAFAATLAQLDDDPLLAALWAEHLIVGWRYYAFAVTNRREAEPELPPGLARATARETWRAWLRRARGEVAAAPPTPPRDGQGIAAIRA